MGNRGPDPDYSEEDVLSFFEEHADPHEPMTATEVADEVGCSRSTAYNLLKDLSDAEVLATKKIGARGRVWWRPASKEE